MSKPRQSSLQRKSPDDIGTIVGHNVRLDRVEYIPIDRLKGYDRKLRTRKKGAIEALQSSLRGFGMVSPILIDQHDTIINGEAIVEAARGLGYTEVPTLRIEHLDETEVRFLRLALNKLAENSKWDDIELAVEFSELLQLDTVLAYEVTGFSTIEIDNLVHPAAAKVGDDPDDAATEIGEAGSEISRLGDMWELGRHRVLCGSSLEAATINLLMAGQLARMVLTDSPYNVKINGHVSGLGKTRHREFAEASGEMSEAQFIEFQCKSTVALAQFCEDGALLYLFMDWRHQCEMMSGIRVAGLSLINMAVWVKRSGGMGSFYRSQHELCYIAKKGTAKHINTVQLGQHGRNRTNCWFYPGVNSFGNGRDELLSMHSTCKNVSMLADAIRDATHRGDIVLDGFLGSGSTLIAAERTQRICRGVELDPLYVDTIIRRWEKATGGQATLHGTGETLTEVAERRAAEKTSGAEASPPLIVPRARIRRAA